MVIRVNYQNLTLQNNLSKTTDRLATAMGRLTTGYKINTASDGAAELMLSKGLEKQISGLSVCNQNAQMAKSLLSTADGALSQITDMAQRIRDLVLSSANGIYSSQERASYQSEIDALTQEIKRQIDEAKFNDYKLFYRENSPTIKTTQAQPISAQSAQDISLWSVSAQSAQVQNVSAQTQYAVQISAYEENNSVNSLETIEALNSEAVLEADMLGLDTGTKSRSARGISVQSVSTQNVSTQSTEASSVIGTYSVSKITQEEAEAQGYTCVSTAQELKDALVAGDSSCKVMLMADIDLDELGLDDTGSNWAAVGTNTTNFLGTLDGNGYTIKNLKMNMAKNHQGLFGCVGGDGAVKNVNIENANIENSASCTGVLVGTNLGTIENCSVKNSTAKVDNGRVGGLAGQNAGEIKNSEAQVNIIGDTEYIGGLIGLNLGNATSCSSAGNANGNSGQTGGFVGYNGGDIQNCYSSANTEGDGILGGFVGLSQQGSVIDFCYATGTVTGSNNGVGGFAGAVYGDSLITSCWATGSVTGNGTCTGGFIGALAEYSQISSCYATGTVTGNDEGVGGFVGATFNNSSITLCHATGNVVGNGMSTGGFAGEILENSSVTYCYATGSTEGNRQTGGFTGATAGSSIITSCYATGNAEGTMNVGGFVGANFSTETISNCYSTGNVKGTDIHIGGFAGGSGNASNPVSIDSCYSTGNVEGNKQTGGFVGTVQNGPCINSYCTGSVTGETGTTGSFAGEARNKTFLDNYAFSISGNTSLNINGIGHVSGTVTGADNTAGKEASWFDKKENIKSILGDGFDYSYFNSILTFQIGTEVGKNNTISVDLRFGITDFKVDVTSAEASRASLDEVDKFIEHITSIQGRIGSAINVMDSVVENNTQTQINLTSSNSRLIDADIAKESAEFVKCQIRENMIASLLTQSAGNMSQIILGIYGAR